jgi:uncharacterized protein YhaN
MRIEDVRLAGSANWPALNLNTAKPGISAVYGPRLSGKTAIAEFLAHVLFGQHAVTVTQPVGVNVDGEVVVECASGRYRLRRYDDGTSAMKLTVAALDAADVDHRTVRSITYGLPTHVLGPLCAIGFREPANIQPLLSEEFARGFQAIIGPNHATVGSTRVAELTARRDVLAQELETRIASERRASKELDSRWQELDRLLRQLHEKSVSCENRLQTIEAALAETDARLRYRRLELGAGAPWLVDGASVEAQQLEEFDSQIAHWRAVLADASARLSTARTKLTALRPERGLAAAAVGDQRAWLTLARQLAADLTGEVSRLARASASQQCICQDVHPRMRPIADTLQRQLDNLALLIECQQRAHEAMDLQMEIDHLDRTESDLRRYIDHLLDRCQRPSCVPGQATATASTTGAFTAADAEQLEHRRIELEQERFRLHEELREHKSKLRDLRAQRDTVERQRASLLSARSIEHVQRELADIQRKLEQAASGAALTIDPAVVAENPYRASDFLAQLTNGHLTRLELVDHGRRARAINRAGETRPIELLSPTERDQVYLSLCLALHSAAAQQDIWLPLVLDDPFVRLDGHSIASLTAVLDGFARQGHQLILFTGQQAAAERLLSLGVGVDDIALLRQPRLEQAATQVAPAPPTLASTSTTVVPKPTPLPGAERSKRKHPRARRSLNGKAKKSDHSDAA